MSCFFSETQCRTRRDRPSGPYEVGAYGADVYVVRSAPICRQIDAAAAGGALSAYVRSTQRFRSTLTTPDNRIGDDRRLRTVRTPLQTLIHDLLFLHISTTESGVS